MIENFVHAVKTKSSIKYLEETELFDASEPMRIYKEKCNLHDKVESIFCPENTGGKQSIAYKCDTKVDTNIR